MKTKYESTQFSSAQSSFIKKFLMNFCDKVRRTHIVLARSKMQEKQNFLKKKFSVSLIYIYIYIFTLYYIYIYIYIYIIFYPFFKWMLKVVSLLPTDWCYINQSQVNILYIYFKCLLLHIYFFIFTFTIYYRSRSFTFTCLLYIMFAN